MPTNDQRLIQRSRKKQRIKIEREQYASASYHVVDSGIDWVTVTWRASNLSPADLRLDSSASVRLAKHLSPYGVSLKRRDSEVEGQRCPVNWCATDDGWALGMYQCSGQVFLRVEMRGCLSQSLDPVTLYLMLIDGFRSTRIMVVGEKISRLDIAADLQGHHRREIECDLEHKFYRGQLKVSKQTTDPPGHGKGWTQYLGKGVMRFCIYNRAAKLKTKQRARKTIPRLTRFEARVRTTALRRYNIVSFTDLQDREKIRRMVDSLTTEKFCFTLTKPDERRARTEPTKLWGTVADGLRSCCLPDLPTGELPIVPPDAISQEDLDHAVSSAQGMIRHVVRKKCALYEFMTEREALGQLLEDLQRTALPSSRLKQ